MVKRKILVLDLDETLIHSHHDGVIRQMVKPGTPPDFVLKVTYLSNEIIKITFIIFGTIKFLTVRFSKREPYTLLLMRQRYLEFMKIGVTGDIMMSRISCARRLFIFHF